MLPCGHAFGCAEGAGDGTHRGGREDPARRLRRRAGVPGLRGQRRLRDRDPHRDDAQRHRVCAGRRGSRGRLERAIRVHRGGEQGQGGPKRDRRGGNADRAVIRLAQLLLLLSAAALWGASRMVWVDVQSFDGLGQPKTTALTGGSWSTALVPLAAILLVAAVAPIAVRGWRLGLLALIVAGVSAVMAYMAISLWVIRDVAVR